MTTTRRAVLSGRVAALAAVALSVARLASAEMCFDVNLHFGKRAPSRAVVESMENEAASIWESYGLRIQWPTTPNSARCAFVRGSFEVFIDANMRQALRNGALGRTWVTPAAIEHAPIQIDLGATERVLRSLRVSELMRLVGRRFATPSDIGRALGRVLAHEIGHLILAARGHQRRGLMRPVFFAGDLVEPQRQSYNLSDAELARLREREVELNARSSASDIAPSKTIPSGFGRLDRPDVRPPRVE
ncbi:MAG TPA: hypothetical protein VK886_13580 [Vicinamibacterales bacterium]|nr:hypothetical protein [Vicinamibacterales bacterium]